LLDSIFGLSTEGVAASSASCEFCLQQQGQGGGLQREERRIRGCVETMSGNWNGRAGSAEHSARRPSPDWVMDVCCNSFTGRTLDCSGHSSEGIDSCKDVFEIRCGTEEGERPVRRISDNSPSTATAVHSMGGYGWDCVDLGGCAQCKGQLNDSMVLYAMGFKFCSVSCFPMGLEYLPRPCFKIPRSASLSLCLLRDPPLYRRG
jgi:hypothetical protein